MLDPSVSLATGISETGWGTIRYLRRFIRELGVIFVGADAVEVSLRYDTVAEVTWTAMKDPSVYIMALTAKDEIRPQKSRIEGEF